jgi:hypothetical protein
MRPKAGMLSSLGHCFRPLYNGKHRAAGEQQSFIGAGMKRKEGRSSFPLDVRRQPTALADIPRSIRFCDLIAIPATRVAESSKA